MVSKDEEKEEEIEEEEEEEEKDSKGNTTFKLIVIFALGITVGFIIHKVLQERNSQKQQERVILVNPNSGGQQVYDHQVTPKFETSTVMHTPKMVNLRNIINKNTPGNNVIEVNGMKIEKDTGHLVVDKNPCKYQTMVVKRDLVTGEIVDIVMMDDGLIK
jgi:hypothetical protein